jgi:5-(carboxyamino)imidazole ribonucleotide synthase
VACIYEERLPLERELSVVLARDATGAVAAFPAGENVHHNGILHTTVVPANVTPELATAAKAAAIQVANALEYEGVLGVELFVANGGRIYLNEIAPRPHNSGHFTQDAAATCQFEQQVRIAAGLPLGDPRLLSPVCMVNLLGEVWANGEPHWADALALPGVRLHLYGKREVRPGRKMGHLNCLATTPEAALAVTNEAYNRLMGLR